MNDVWKTIQYTLGVTGAAVMTLWAVTPHTVQLLLMLMVFDFGVGLLAAFINKELDSDISFRGVAKKVITLLVIGVSAILQSALYESGYTVPLVAIVAGFYLINETLSILENVILAGLPVPNELKEALVKIGRTKIVEVDEPDT